MTRHGDIWALIGIEPTDDVRAIRRGYAAALKQIDVDAEPDRFAALREAFEAATAMANAGMVAADEPATVDEPPPEDDRWSAQPPPDVTIIAETALPDDIATQPEPLADLPPRSPWEQAAIDDANARAGKLEDLLLTHQQGRQHANVNPNPGEASAMLDHWRVLAADPRMGDLGHYAQVEAWISEIIARALPFSDPLVPVVSDYFGWVEKAAMIGQSSAVQFIVRHRASMVFVAAVSERKHPLHGAWKELTKPARENSRRGAFVRRSKINKLLTTIRSDYPELEDRFDSWRVGLWDDKEPSSISIATVIFGILIGVRLLIFLGDSTSPSRQPDLPTIQPPTAVLDELTTPKPDIDRALKTVSKNAVSGDEVATGNPAFFRDLNTMWDKVNNDTRDYWDFQAAVSQSIYPRLNRVQGKASYEPLRHRIEAQIAQARYFREQGPAYCDGYFSADRSAPVTLSDELLTQERKAVYEVLLDAGADRPDFKRPKTFSVPGELVNATRISSKLDREAFDRAWKGKGRPGELCAVEMALRSEVLKLPRKQGLALMRVM